jgi:hypothetical protein
MGNVWRNPSWFFDEMEFLADFPLNVHPMAFTLAGNRVTLRGQTGPAR